VFTRLQRRLFGEDKAGIRYDLMGGSSGAETAGLDVGAPVGTDVYAPVDGTVLGIMDYVVGGKKFGVRIDIQPSGSPGLVVSLRNLDPDPALSVGSTVAAARTKMGSVLDISSVETSARRLHPGSRPARPPGGATGRQPVGSRRILCRGCLRRAGPACGRDAPLGAAP
jgi:hypothetical protein